jgi:hypothetical protein
MPTFERIIPVLTYRDIPAAHDFLVHAFGFVAGGVNRTPDGEPTHGEVRVGMQPSGCIASPLSTIWILLSPQMWQIPAWSSTSMMSTRTTSALVWRVPTSTASPSISRMVSVNMGRGTWKATDGGLPHQ